MNLLNLLYRLNLQIKEVLFLKHLLRHLQNHLNHFLHCKLIKIKIKISALPVQQVIFIYQTQGGAEKINYFQNNRIESKFIETLKKSWELNRTRAIKQIVRDSPIPLFFRDAL